MEIPYAHIIAVPASEETINQPLMAALAGQIMGYTDRRRLFVVTAAGKEELPVVQPTAGLLQQELLSLGAVVLQQNCLLGFSPIEPEIDSATRFLAKRALDLPRPEGAEVLVIVTSRDYAERMARIVLIDLMGDDSINPEIDQVLAPGEAAIVDCQNRRRDALHPQGYGPWLVDVVLDRRLAPGT